MTNDSQTCGIVNPLTTVVKELFISSGRGGRRIRPQGQPGVIGNSVITGVGGLSVKRNRVAVVELAEILNAAVDDGAFSRVK